MTANVLVKESCPRPVQTQRHITKVTYVDLAARKLNLLNLQLYIYIYIYTHTHTHIYLLPCSFGVWDL